MATNILQLPLLSVTFATADNEDWRDGIAFTTAGQITPYAAASNAGNGTLTSLGVVRGAWIGDYVVTMTSPMAYRVSDPDNNTIGAGLTGVPFSRSGVQFTVQAGTIPFAAGDQLFASVVPTMIDLTGIAFRMMARVGAARPTINLDASTDNGWIVNGTTSGVLGLAVPQSAMAGLPSGTYVCDILALADGVQRRCVDATINHVNGVTQIPAGA